MFVRNENGERETGRTGDLFPVLLLVISTALAYAPVWHAGFVWDDNAYVTQNPLLTASDGLRRIWFSLDSPSQYFPLTYTSFYIEHALWGFKPLGYHLANVALQAANAVLLWRLLSRLGIPGAWLAAAIFALHPVQVESVAWVTERKNLLMGFFFLLSLREWVEFIEDKDGRSPRHYVLSLVFFALSISAKTTACTLPIALLLVLWFNEIPVSARRWRQIAPYVVISVGMGLLTVWWERFHQGTQGKMFYMGFVERLLLASRALWFYLGKLFWPANLTFSYPRWKILATSPAAWAWLAVTICAAALIYQTRRRFGRGLATAAVFFAATLFPVLGFIMLYTFMYSFVADHYQYLASIGPIALVAAGLSRGAKRLTFGKPFLLPAVSAALLLTLGMLTWRQCGMYSNLETLWEATLQRNPASWLAQDNYGHILLLRGQLEDAAGHFKKALEIEPEAANPHFNLGNALRREGKLEEAITQYHEALRINPSFAAAHANLGKTLAQQGKVEQAMAEYKRAIEINPSDADACLSLGMAFYEKGEIDDAIVQYQKALQINPGSAQGHFNLGVAYLQKRQPDQALRELAAAVQLRPNYLMAENYLGDALLQTGRFGEAIWHFNAALQIDPKNPAILNNLAWLLATSPDNAIRNGQEAVSLAERADSLTKGDNPLVVCTLAAAYAEVGRFPEATQLAQHALQMALAQSNTNLAAELKNQIELYQLNQPFHNVAAGVKPGK